MIQAETERNNVRFRLIANITLANKIRRCKTANEEKSCLTMTSSAESCTRISRSIKALETCMQIAS